MRTPSHWKPLSVLGIFIAAFALVAPVMAGESANFSKHFKKIAPEEIGESVFTLIGKDWNVTAAGSPANAMVNTFSGFGMVMDKPAAWNLLAANRYTLEKIQETGTYTMSFFEEKNRGDILKFGKASGRNSDKMKETKLTPVTTPSGAPSFAEAKLVVEVRLLTISDIEPGKFTSKEMREFLEKGRDKEKGYHKLVFGEIVGVWRKK